ncbi:hypothetical protein TWF225_004529 [Orbilia oligospora]|nr:hypothetical protein TWF225_004529 [Orbilia oligospora]KAF3244850.1 hypothetical protein TWF128_009569 [Orbilia oligospora]KAF3250128.1 hypothetical protein TWF217_008606 [Orbilia oligospora]
MSDEITDAVAASLLKKEAAERSLRYSAFGLVAFAGDRKKPNSAPKPNTRFLKNLVKEADSHNAALLAKEAEEARLRLEKLRREDGRSKGRDRDREKERHHHHHRRSSRSRSPNARSTRRKERSRSRSKERGKRDRDGDRKGVKRQRVEIGDIDRLLQASRRERRDGEKGKDKERDRERSNRDRERSYSRERGSHRDRRDKGRRRSKSWERTKRSHRSGRSRTRSPSQSRSRSSSPDKRRHKSHKRHKSRSRSPSDSQSPRKRRRSDSPKVSRLSPPQDDEDPLAEYLAKKSADRSPEIGPSFPYKSKNGPRPRGRGLPGSSAMDARFDPSYDPTMDVTPTNPEDEDDWEAALEALRDRQKWKQQGKERLKAAGFDNDFIEAWETNTTKDESRIKWSKDKGGRDWDRGKVIDDETGEIKLKASWGTS